MCNRALGYVIILNVLLYTSQVYEYVHLTKGKKQVAVVNDLHLAAHFSTFFIGASEYLSCCSVCTCQSTVTSTRKLRCMSFCWSLWYNPVKFGNSVKRSCSCYLVFQETVYDTYSQHVMIMPAQCRLHYIGYALSDIN